ncbi:hypothetical protein AGLY_012191 [Aphis glycines]|uniref:Uncharacterized protein n=1 Tax=Aphis glycines TaxID=307491 RepID=A0A6G0T9J1_APHGL|nr:hypothetical protein AGLY_012191 [Aphis glycines]
MFLNPMDVPDMRLNRTPFSDNLGSLHTSISHWTSESVFGSPCTHSNRKRSRCSVIGSRSSCCWGFLGGGDTDSEAAGGKSNGTRSSAVSCSDRLMQSRGRSLTTTCSVRRAQLFLDTIRQTAQHIRVYYLLRRKVINDKCYQNNNRFYCLNTRGDECLIIKLYGNRISWDEILYSDALKCVFRDLGADYSIGVFFTLLNCDKLTSVHLKDRLQTKVLSTLLNYALFMCQSDMISINISCKTMLCALSQLKIELYTYRLTNLDDIFEKNDGLCTDGSCGLPVLLVGPTPSSCIFFDTGSVNSILSLEISTWNGHIMIVIVAGTLLEFGWFVFKAEVSPPDEALLLGLELNGILYLPRNTLSLSSLRVEPSKGREPLTKVRHTEDYHKTCKVYHQLDSYNDIINL